MKDQHQRKMLTELPSSKVRRIIQIGEYYRCHRGDTIKKQEDSSSISSTRNMTRKGGQDPNMYFLQQGKSNVFELDRLTSFFSLFYPWIVLA